MCRVHLGRVFPRLWLCCCLALVSVPLRAVELEVALRPVFAGEPLRLDALSYTSGAGETLSVTRLSVLLSGWALEREDGGWEELPGCFAWLDAEQRRMTARLTGIPAGRYRALRFHLGPDAATNAADPTQWSAEHPLNPNLNRLHWGWQGGYIFLALEGRYRAAAGELRGFAHHLARDENRTRISLVAPLDLTTHGAGVVLDFDLGAMLGAPRPLGFARDGEATHSRESDPVAAALVANLPGAFRVQQVLSQAPAITRPAPMQPLFLPERWTAHRFTMNRTFPMPNLPRDNPLITERVALGARLFQERALSRDGSLSCASCHAADAAFTDGRAVSVGFGGTKGTRNAMPLFNLAWKTSFFWDGRAPTLRAQVLDPIQDHAEMGAALEGVVEKLAAAREYSEAFRAAFGSAEITSQKLALALENFLLTLTAGDAKLDRTMRGAATLSSEEARGFELFLTENDPRTGQRGADCFHCHGGPLFSDHGFHNNGLLSSDPGRFRVTGSEADRGKFSTPSLRNVERTAPYMHDGRFASLEEVVAHYSSGVQRTPTLDPNLAKHPVGGLRLNAADQAALVAFLRTLTEL
jgi:cytochrome c peroxidase